MGGDSNGALADASTGGNPNHQYNWSNGSTEDFIENLPAGAYTLLVSDEKGCEDQTSVNLEAPLPLSATINKQDITCFSGENSGAITINNPSGGVMPYLYSVNNQPFTGNTEIQNLPAGAYSILMQDNMGCEVIFEDIIITNPSGITVDLGEDREIQLGATIELNPQVNGEVIYEWSSSDTLSCLNCPSIQERPFKNTTYSVKVTNIETGCIAEDAISIAVLKARNLYVPNAFSPNGDGVNDGLVILGGVDIDRILNFEIYARNGSRVFKKENFNLNDGIGWDGTFDRQELSTDVFIYFAEVLFIDGEKVTFKGDFTLIR